MGRAKGVSRVVAPTLAQTRPRVSEIRWHNVPTHRPELAKMAAHVIADWSRVETALTGILAGMLGGEAQPAAAMYKALSGSTARQSAFEAVARDTLTQPQLQVFEALMSIYRVRADERNPVAHHIWGYTDDLDDAMLLCDPRHFLDHQVGYAIWMAKSESMFMFEVEEALDEPEQKIGAEKIRVYRHDTFVEIRRGIQSLERLMSRFRVSLLPNSWFDIPAGLTPDVVLRRLSDAPEIRAVLDHPTRGSKTPPAAPPQPPESTGSG